jgi:hypothetical protein
MCEIYENLETIEVDEENVTWIIRRSILSFTTGIKYYMKRTLAQNIAV